MNLGLKTPGPDKSKLEKHLEALEDLKVCADELCDGIRATAEKLVIRANGAMHRLAEASARAEHKILKGDEND